MNRFCKYCKARIATMNSSIFCEKHLEEFCLIEHKDFNNISDEFLKFYIDHVNNWLDSIKRENTKVARNIHKIIAVEKELSNRQFNKNLKDIIDDV